MKTIKLMFAGLMFASAILVVSCKKSADAPDSDTSGASDNALAENTSNDIVEIGAQASDNNALMGNLSSYRVGSDENTLSGGCASYVIDTANKTITVTFDNSPCNDGRKRSGSLIYNYTGSPAGGHYRTPGFTFTVTSNNYTVDGNQVNIISKTVTNTTPVGFNYLNTNETWSINASINIVKAGGGSISWTCNRVKTLLNTSTTYTNANTPIDWPDARIGLTGNASGSRSTGETFTVNVTSQLVRDFGSCHPLGRVPFILGTLTYTPSTAKYPRYIDFGAPNNGACDFGATVTINGIVYTILLP